MKRVFLMLMAGWVAMGQQSLTQPPLVPLDKLSIPKADEGVTDADQPQADSLAGNALFGVKDKDGKITAALKAMEADKSNAELRLVAGRVQDGYLRFLESIPVYEDGVEKFPADYRFRYMVGRRQISVRKFGDAIKSLEKAAKMVPNSFDVAYYLGLGYYFNGDHSRAAKVFDACEAQVSKPLAEKPDLKGGRACDALGADPNQQVAIAYWHFLALRRAGDNAAAKAYIDSKFQTEINVTSSKPFFEAVQFFQGKKEINEMLVGANEGLRDALTRSSAAATYLFTEGERAKGCGIWARNAMDQNWDHLGAIQAESEYYLNSKTACALYGAPQPAK